MSTMNNDLAYSQVGVFRGRLRKLTELSFSVQSQGRGRALSGLWGGFLSRDLQARPQ